MKRSVLATFALALALASPLALARADDWRLDTDVVGQSYEVRSPDGAAFLVRRRLTVLLGGLWTRTLDAARPVEGPRLRAVIRIRLEQDFGNACSLVIEDLCFRESSPGVPSDFVPGWDANRVDAPLVYVEASGLPLGVVARAGRQLVLDPLGMLAMDGAAVAVSPRPWLTLDALGGMLVSGASPLGVGRWEPLGIRRADRDGWDDALATHVEDDALLFVAGAAVAVETRAGRLQVLWRRTWNEDGDSPIEAVGAQARLSLGRLGVTSRGVVDLSRERLTTAETRATLRLGDLDARSVELGVYGTHDEPTFDATSIWSYFTSFPSDVLGVQAGLVHPSWELRAGARLRYVHGQLSSAGQDASLLEPGADASASWRRGRLRLALSAFVTDGAVSPLAGSDLSGELALSRSISLEARASAWYFEDAVRPALDGAVLSTVLGASWRVGAARFSFELEGAASEAAGLRLRGLGVAHFEGWL